jgi:hypothetical protein
MVTGARLKQALGQFTLGLAVILGFSIPGHAHAAGPQSDFADWSAMVVAGDWHAHSGAPSEVFDNARRDIARALVSAGFDPQNVAEFSVRPERYRAPKPYLTNLQSLFETLDRAPPTARGGCLVYLTSHGSPLGIVFGDNILTPAMLGTILDQTCGQRPTITVISACFSGVFINPLSRPNRMIFTAARSDRTSFGCGESDLYPYFDTCFLSQVSQAQDFARLASQVQTCISVREQTTGVSPASEPQLYLGAQIRPLLALLQLDNSPIKAAQR